LAENPFLWSTTASDNDDADPAVAWPEGMAPGQVNNSARATMAGIARLIADLNGSITTTGSAGSYAATSSSGYTALTNGLLLTVKASVTNTAGATLNVNTLGAKSIRVFVGGAEAAVAAGQIISGGTYQFRYDTALNSAAGGWLLLNPSPDPTAQVSTGDIKVWPTDTLPAGFLWANGEAVSRTTYAALFAIISTTYGVGDGSTTFNLPDLCGRAPFGSDDMGGITLKSRVTNASSGIVGTTLGATGGAQSVVLDTTMIPSHTHTGTTASGGSHSHSGTTDNGGVDHTHGVASGADAYNITVDGGAGDVAGAFAQNTGGASAYLHTHPFSTTSDGSHTHTFTSASTGGGLLHTNMPPALIVNFIIRH